MKRLLFSFLILLFPSLISAQTSGGQIRRNSPKPKTEVRKTSKPRSTTSQTEQNTPTYTPPSVTQEVQLVLFPLEQMHNTCLNQ